MKDNFSNQAKEYSKYRPIYPRELIEYLVSLTAQQNCAWDCGTGNGQLAVKLSEHFAKIHATDISKNQIDNAEQKRNIIYKIAPSERTEFDNNQFDLITVAQAIHWFNFDKFYKEVFRTLNQNGIFAVIGYLLPSINTEIDEVVNDYYSNTLGDYWDKERKYVDEGYKKIPFPFEEIQTPSFEIIKKWTHKDLIGFLNTWSATQHFIKRNNLNPVEKISEALKKIWIDDKVKTVIFSVLLRIGKLQS